MSFLNPSLPMDITSVYVNMLCSVSFVTPTQTECVCCSEGKNPLFVRDLAPHQSLLCRKASAAIAWGSFMHWGHVQGALWKGNKKGSICFLLYSSNIRENSQVVWLFSKVFCWHSGNQESLAEIPIHWPGGSLNGEVLIWTSSWGFLLRQKRFIGF